MSAVGNVARQRPVAIVLVDAEDEGLARPLCTNADLCRAVYDEVEREDSRAKARAPWRRLGVGATPAGKRKEELVAKVSGTVRAVLTGERPPPAGVPRVIDAASRELTALAKESGANIACQLFVVTRDAHADAPAAIAPALFGGVLPTRLAENWDAAATAAPPPTFVQVCAGGFRGATAVLVISSRLLPSYQPLTEQLTEGDDALPKFSWIHCAAIDADQLDEVSKLCADHGGGAATSVSTGIGLHEALRAAFSMLPAPEGSSQSAGAAVQTDNGVSAALGGASSTMKQTLDDAEHFDVAWPSPGPLGLDFLADRWVVGQSLRPEVRVGDVLVSVGTDLDCGDAVVASGADAASVEDVTSALKSEYRPLVLTFARRRSGPEGGDHRPSVLDAPSTEKAKALISESFKRFAPPSMPLAKLLPDAKSLIDLGAERLFAPFINAPCAEVRNLRRTSAGGHISRALDADREPNQRILIEWLLALCRVFAFAGDATTLCRASFACRRWRGLLDPDGSDLALCVWKWSIRFGEPVHHSRRWALWHWLLSGGGCKLRRARGPARRPPVKAGAAGAEALAGRMALGYYSTLVERGRSEDAFADARAVIVMDLQRARKSAATSAEDRLSTDCRNEALERILLAIAAERPALGYCQGLDLVVAFVLSIAEDAGAAPESLEAETFAVVASLLDSEMIASWMEPPLSGLREATSALGLLLEERRPQLVSHLRSEGAGVELLGLAWLQTLFAGFTPLPRGALCRIWDCWLLDATPKVFFRVALQLLGEAEPFLQGQPLERVSEVLRTYPPPLDAALHSERLLAEAWTVKVTNTVLRRALKTAALEGETRPPDGQESGSGPRL